jgi:hypothetical protein
MNSTNKFTQQAAPGINPQKELDAQQEEDLFRFFNKKPYDIEQIADSFWDICCAYYSLTDHHCENSFIECKMKNQK